MAILLTDHFLKELKKNQNAKNVIVELALDSGVRKFGYATGRLSPEVVDYLFDNTYYFDGAITFNGVGDVNGVDAFTDVNPCLKFVSSLQNKIDEKGGFSTRGEMTVVISGRNNFKAMVRDEYLKNRRVTIKQGFIAQGFGYPDYAPIFTGRIKDWSRKGDDLTIIVADDLLVATFKKKIPKEANTSSGDPINYIIYSDKNPMEVMYDVLAVQLNIDSALIDTDQFTSEKELWLGGWKFNRVLIEPSSPNDILNELQVESNSTIIHDGEKITIKVFAPPSPGIAVEEYTDNFNIADNSFSVKSGYKEQFYNRVVICYDYDESNQDEYTNYQNIVIFADAASQGTAQWNDVSTKFIKSRWIRSYCWTQPVNIHGAAIFHTSVSNGVGSGTLTYTAATKTITWQANGDSVGAAVKLGKAGRYQLFSADPNKYVRILLYDATALPITDKSDTITLTEAPAAAYANYIGQKLLSRYRDPASIVSFDLPINNVAFGSRLIKPTDLKDVTTDEALEKGSDTWSKERVMITSARIDFDKDTISLEAIETKFYSNYGFVASTGFPDYSAASEFQRKYAFIGRAGDNKVYDGANYVSGFHIW